MSLWSVVRVQRAKIGRWRATGNYSVRPCMEIASGREHQRILSATSFHELFRAFLRFTCAYTIVCMCVYVCETDGRKKPRCARAYN